MHHMNSPRLAAREKESLLRATAGKNAFETASLLSISADTVNVYIKNCLRKLDAVDKTATAKTMTVGLLPQALGAH